MSDVLFVWELGGGYGHLGHMLPLARQLRAAGHRVTFALKDLARARDTITEPEFRLLQAPVWLPAPSGMPAPASYAGRAGEAWWTGLPGLTINRRSRPRAGMCPGSSVGRACD